MDHKKIRGLFVHIMFRIIRWGNAPQCISCGCKCLEFVVLFKKSSNFADEIKDFFHSFIFFFFWVGEGFND